MKLDRSKDFGTVSGHPYASYEQDGKLFGADFEEVTDDGDVPPIQTPDAKKFLAEILAGGRMGKTSIVKEAENRGIPWIDIERAFRDMGIVSEKAGSDTLWKLGSY